MSELNNAVCDICLKPYRVCNSCADQKLKPWLSVTDTLEHYKIYLAIHNYDLTKDKEKAKKELECCDISDMDSFNPNIKRVIKEIMSGSKKIRTITKKEYSTENIEVRQDDIQDNIVE